MFDFILKMFERYFSTPNEIRLNNVDDGVKLTTHIIDNTKGFQEDNIHDIANRYPYI